MKRLYHFQEVIGLVVGLGALFGGALAIIDPYGTLFRMPVEVLKKGPFSSFLIPGLFLFFIVGLGHLFSFTAVRRRWKLHPYISGGAGCILMSWIVIQCYIMESVHFLHVIFFAAGLAEGLAALLMLVGLKLFPFSGKSFRLY